MRGQANKRNERTKGSIFSIWHHSTRRIDRGNATRALPPSVSGRCSTERQNVLHTPSNELCFEPSRRKLKVLGENCVEKKRRKGRKERRWNFSRRDAIIACVKQSREKGKDRISREEKEKKNTIARVKTRVRREKVEFLARKKKYNCLSERKKKNLNSSERSIKSIRAMYIINVIFSL